MKADPSEYILVQVLSNESKSVASRRPLYIRVCFKESMSD